MAFVDIVERFSHVVREHVHLPAVEFGGRTWCYGEIDRWSDEIAGRLCEHCVPPGGVAVIDCERSALLVLAMLACVKARIAFFVVGENQPETYVGRVLEDLPDVFWLGAAGYSTQARARRAAGDRLRGCYLFDADRHDDPGSAELRATDRPIQAGAQRGRGEVDAMYLVATSGSTGRPKLVLSGMGPVANFIDWYQGAFALSARDKFSMLSGLGYDPLIRDVFTPLCVGACVTIPPKDVLSSRRGLRDWIAEARVSVVHATPPMAELIFDAREERVFDSVRVVAIGGAALTKRLAARIKAQLADGSLVNVYGASETPQVMTHHIVDERYAADTSGLVPLGKPISGVSVQILNDDGEAVGAGEVGEIHITTPHLSQGYYRDPERTGQRFRFCERHGCRSYRSGDVGFLDGEGNLNFVGRKDRQVKCRGHRIQLEELEKALLELDEIVAAAVLHGDPAGADKLTCYLQYRPNAGHKLSQIKQKLVSVLPAHMMPDSYVVVERMPLNSNGKIDYGALAKVTPSAESMLQVTASVKDSRIAEQLRAIWSEVLGVPAAVIALNSNWFDVGGTSLLSARVVERINARWARKLTITDVFVYSTISDLSEYIARHGDARDVVAGRVEVGKRMDRLNSIRVSRNRRVSAKESVKS